MADTTGVNCAEIARDKLGQPVYETFSIKRTVVFTSLNFAFLRLRNYLYGGVKLGYPLQNTRIRLLEWQQPRETVALSDVCECIVPNVSCWNR